MAAKKTNWGVILGAVGILFVIWYLLTRKQPVAGSSGGGGIVGGGGSPSGIPGQQPQQGGGGLGLSPSFGGGGGGGSSSLAASLKKWISGVVNQGYQNAAGLSLSPTDELSGLGTAPGLSIPSDPFQLFDVSQLTQDIPGYDDSGDPGLLEETDLADQSIPSESFNWGGYSPNDFLVTSDVSEPADLSNYNIDPNYGADQLSVDGNGDVYDSTGYDFGASDSGGGGGVDYSY